MALTADRATEQKEGVLVSIPVKANVKCYAGGIAVTSGGYAAPGSVATTLTYVGMFTETVDNTGGADGAKSVLVRRGRAFKWSNSTSTDEITQADIMADCYIVDDETVAKTSGTSTRSKAGKVIGVDATGVWVL
jgi:hypothetical protein